jgi:hypothetical protein
LKFWPLEDLSVFLKNWQRKKQPHLSRNGKGDQ